MKPVLRETLRVDANHQLHVNVPADMGDEFEVIVLPVRPQPGKNEIGDRKEFMENMLIEPWETSK